MAQQFTWSDKMSVGVDVIDDQHKQLLKMINHLYMIEDSSRRAEIKQILDELVNYTLSHFAFEEGVMEEANYPLLRPHKRVHDLFVKRVSEFYERFNKGEDVLIELRQIVSRWLLNHIMHEDMAFSKTVIAHLNRVTLAANRANQAPEPVKVAPESKAPASASTTKEQPKKGFFRRLFSK